VVGGGSNLVASDADFHGTVVHLRDPEQAPTTDSGCEVSAPIGLPDIPAPSCGGVILEHFAGVNWDRAVAYAVDHELIGIECLSGIPGTVGASPIQNVGAYGQDVSATTTRVRTWDRERGAVRTFFASDCRFGYRTSLFKQTPYPGSVASATGRFVVLSVTFQHRQGELSTPVKYAELARRLGVGVGDRVPMQQLRSTVLEIRAGKGMVLDPADHDTWSAGSFFTNPILPAEVAATLPETAPRFDAGDGLVKTSAAWLISNAGFDRGFSIGPRASLSTKHSLALTNRGGASSEDVVALARAVRDGVRDRFGITLEAEPVRWGVEL
jgi:UDP-N-acetylmuramate dehydrogenase